MKTSCKYADKQVAETKSKWIQANANVNGHTVTAQFQLCVCLHLTLAFVVAPVQPVRAANRVQILPWLWRVK